MNDNGNGPHKKQPAYEVRCPACHALLFMSVKPWESVRMDWAEIATKCWRRSCGLVLGYRRAKEELLQ